MNGIALHDVSKTFGNRRALNGVTISIEAGERAVLTGPSGCGKTTVLRLIAGLEVPDSAPSRSMESALRNPGAISSNLNDVASGWSFRIWRYGPT
jgi:iron(III) transport system ATP-binding protein